MKTLILTLILIASWERNMEAGRTLRKTNVRLSTSDASIERERLHNLVLIAGLSVMSAVQSVVALDPVFRFYIAVAYNSCCLATNAAACILYKRDSAQFWKLAFIWSNVALTIGATASAIAWRL